MSAFPLATVQRVLKRDTGYKSLSDGSAKTHRAFTDEFIERLARETARLSQEAAAHANQRGVLGGAQVDAVVNNTPWLRELVGPDSASVHLFQTSQQPPKARAHKASKKQHEGVKAAAAGGEKKKAKKAKAAEE